MANKGVGEHAFQVGEAAYTLRFGALAIDALETELGRSIIEIAQELEDDSKRRMGTVIAVIRAGLSEHHDDLDKKAVAKIMDECGLPGMMQHLSAAMNLAFPEQRQGEEANGANPPDGNRHQRRAAKAKG